MALKNLVGTVIPVCTCRRANRTFYTSRGRFPEAHRGFSFFFFCAGRAEISLNSAAFTAGRNDVLILQKGDAYTFRTLNNQPVSYYNVGLGPVTAEGIITSRRALGLEPFCRSSRPGETTRLLKTLLKTFQGKGRYRMQECSMLGLRLLLLLKPSGEAEGLPPETPDNRPPEERILDIVDHINHHYKDRLALKPLAGQIAMDLSRFSRTFRKVTGLSPHRYILEKKIMKARDSLLHYQESLSAVAEDLGFHDYSHFSRAFRVITGETPGGFLKREKRKMTPTAPSAGGAEPNRSFRS